MKHVIRGTPPNDRLAAGLAQFVAAGSLRRFLFVSTNMRGVHSMTAYGGRFDEPSVFEGVALHSSRTSLGTSFSAAKMSRGTIITSSKWPSTGMKSGIRSTGESAYAMAIPISIFATLGVRGCRRTRWYTAISRRNAAAALLNFFNIRTSTSHPYGCTKPHGRIRSVFRFPEWPYLGPLIGYSIFYRLGANALHRSQGRRDKHT